jgi:hypothetical protein
VPASVLIVDTGILCRKNFGFVLTHALSGKKSEVCDRAMAKGKGGFKNVKLGKNVYRQLKRRGPPQPVPSKNRKSDQRNQKPAQSRSRPLQ